MAMITIEVEKNPSESNASVLRRFTRRVQDSGIIKKVRKQRYASRPLSKFNKKKYILKAIERRTEVERLLKLGKTIKKKR